MDVKAEGAQLPLDIVLTDLVIGLDDLDLPLWRGDALVR